MLSGPHISRGLFSLAAIERFVNLSVFPLKEPRKEGRKPKIHKERFTELGNLTLSSGLSTTYLTVLLTVSWYHLALRPKPSLTEVTNDIHAASSGDNFEPLSSVSTQQHMILDTLSSMASMPSCLIFSFPPLSLSLHGRLAFLLPMVKY